MLLDHEAVTPDGKFTGAPIPVAPVVVRVIAVKGVLIHNVGAALAELTVLSAFIVTRKLSSSQQLKAVES